MPRSIIAKGNKGGYVTARFSIANAAGGFVLNSATPGFGANTVGETVDSATIIEAAWALGANSALIKRGANTVLRLTGEGQISFVESGMQLETTGEAKANVQVVMPGAGFVILKLHKSSTFTSNY